MTRVKYADPAFNLYDDTALVAFLDDETMFSYEVATHGGRVEVPFGVLRKALRKAADLHLTQTTITRLRLDIAASKARGEDCVLYDCF